MSEQEKQEKKNSIERMITYISLSISVIGWIVTFSVNIALFKKDVQTLNGSVQELTEFMKEQLEINGKVVMYIQMKEKE